jgi:hypothetical protein
MVFGSYWTQLGPNFLTRFHSEIVCHGKRFTLFVQQAEAWRLRYRVRLFTARTQRPRLAVRVYEFRLPFEQRQHRIWPAPDKGPSPTVLVELPIMHSSPRSALCVQSRSVTSIGTKTVDGSAAQKTCDRVHKLRQKAIEPRLAGQRMPAEIPCRRRCFRTMGAFRLSKPWRSLCSRRRFAFASSLRNALCCFHGTIS